MEFQRPIPCAESLIESLPPEIYDKILHYLPQKSRAELRSVSTRCCNKTEPYLFNTISIGIERRSLTWLEKLSNNPRIASQVQTVYISIALLPRQPKVFEAYRREHVLASANWSEREARVAYRDYELICREQENLEGNGDHLRILEHAFSRFVNLRCAGTLGCTTKLLWNPSMIVDKVTSIQNRIGTPPRYWGRWKRSRRITDENRAPHLRALISTLPPGLKFINLLAFGYWGGWDLFTIKEEERKLAERVFKDVVELRLVCQAFMSAHHKIQGREVSIYRLLTAMPALQFVVVDFHPSGQFDRDFGYLDGLGDSKTWLGIFGTINYAHLQKLVLINCKLAASDLQEFVLRHEKLKIVELINPTFEGPPLVPNIRWHMTSVHSMYHENTFSHWSKEL